ncbi:MAG: methylenetetrahydrofolate--tRNA-(uracil(54)-C(5))-methyltransferase (FADH(2)-oxidizing) TrmFO [Clostridia bacterium]|nr:methylenetetrahydrofolate--tRNA-(uracil(54)-C(5))-methyltransferase (FADH(2)-oxidizing) TrmFO [Clostridia bacterium]MBQ2462308.1 methylenetetrahydrofolate--tRNA-(uracil(54)-C(5))-methyltransferase (FADH(2)-oxidizing) TrmFO [Clostridia bacterium]
MNHATVIGAGLAGSEAAWQLAQQGIEVTLVEMKPERKTPAHHSDGFAELVCSNSLRSDRLTNGVGLLKEEMRRLSSLIMESADRARVPAGGALAVDRDVFSGWITSKLTSHPKIQVVQKECTEIPEGPCIIATGPLTSDAMADAISKMPGLSTLSFYDAAAPIVTLESLDETKVFRQSRYGRGDDYLNCPMTEEEYHAFVDALIHAETAEIHGFEEKKVFEGCMPVESMARRGEMVLAFGPLKPVGLTDPRTGKQPFAVVQLRQDNAEGTLYNLVGFQTRLKFPEQKRVFGMIPGLEHASFARYGVMHRNTFLHSPGFLNAHFEVISRPLTYFAGQMTGVEGYVESAASGLLCGLSLGHQLRGLGPVEFPGLTAIGSMGRYVSTPNARFQPMNCTFGLIDSLPVDAEHKKIRNKQMRYTAVSERALAWMDAWVQQDTGVAEATESE